MIYHSELNTIHRTLLKRRHLLACVVVVFFLTLVRKRLPLEHAYVGDVGTCVYWLKNNVILALKNLLHTKLHNALLLFQLIFRGQINSKDDGYIAVGGLYIVPGYCEIQPPNANQGEHEVK